MFGIRTFMCSAAVVAALSAASTAGAVSLEMTKYSRQNAAQAQTQMSDYLASHRVSNLRTETFDSYDAWNGTTGSANPKKTNVGSFTARGKAGSGKSSFNGGDKLQVRNDNSMKWGRYNSNTPSSTGIGNNWLDSNDNQKMEWRVKSDKSFNTIGFFVSDIADVGGKFSIKVGNKVFSDLANGKKLKSGNVHFVLITLDEMVKNTRVVLMHDRANDGFGIDTAMVANVEPVPLPPAAALLLTGVAGIGALRLRRKKASA
ncbi:hypothetical protein [Amaricoccus macauensis]|uniref:hypothetical protein n=1 Tax=Amaricoccus macauensis TaxID=57001 RepID=UPI003C7CC69D